MTVREIFRKNLKYYRKQNNLTQEELSEKIGLNPKYIADIESRSKFPSAETIDALAEALKIIPAQLFLERGTPLTKAEFDKTSFAEHLVTTISSDIKSEIVQYLEKNL